MVVSGVSSFSAECFNAFVTPGPIRDVGVIMLSPLTRRRRLRCSRNPSWLNLSVGCLAFLALSLDMRFTSYVSESGTTRVPKQVVNGENGLGLTVPRRLSNY